LFPMHGWTMFVQFVAQSGKSRRHTVKMLIILLFSLLQMTNEARILLSTMDQGRSHASSFIPLAKRVQRSGNHSVHLQMTVYEKEIDLGLPVEYVELFGQPNPFVSKEFIEAMWEVDFDVLMQRMALGFGAQGCRLAIENARDRVEAIAEAGWDLTMVDSLFAVCGYGIAARSGAPVVYMHSSDMEPAPGTMKAFGRNYGILPMNHMTGGRDDFDPSNFFDRVHSSVEWAISYYFYAIEWGATMKEVLSPVVPYFDWRYFHRNLSFSFVDMPDSLFPPAPRTNDVFFHGAYCPVRKELPEEWREFVEDPASKGTIIVAFGTYVHWSLAPEEKQEAFRLALNRLSSYRIIWAYKGVDDWRKPPIEGTQRVPSAERGLRRDARSTHDRGACGVRQDRVGHFILCARASSEAVCEADARSSDGFSR
ncbi:ugt-64, partial [Pristionchus pacificus]